MIFKLRNNSIWRANSRGVTAKICNSNVDGVAVLAYLGVRISTLYGFDLYADFAMD